MGLLYFSFFFVFLSSTYCGVFCCQLVVACFFTNLLGQVVVSSMVNFFVGFRVNSSNDKIRSNRVIRSNHIHQYVVDLESYVL